MMLREVKFHEDSDFLLQSDAIDLYHYFRTFRTGAADEPERRLMRAIFEDALRCLDKYIDAKTRRRQELYREAEEWLLSDSDDWIFSFSSVCEALGLNPAYMRKRVLWWKERTIAMRVPNTAGSKGRLRTWSESAVKRRNSMILVRKGRSRLPAQQPGFRAWVRENKKQAGIKLIGRAWPSKQKNASR